MPKLSKMGRTDLQMLLEAHSELQAAAAKIGKRNIVAGITTSNTFDDKDFVSVTIDAKFATQAVKQQIAKVEKALAEYGVVPK